MSDITIDVANTRLGTGTQLETVTAGETVSFGEPVYQDAADASEYKRCDASTSGTAKCDGIAWGYAGDGEQFMLLKVSAGTVNLGATLTKGTAYVVSATTGGIAPASDLSSGDFVSVLGVATSTTELMLNITNTGVTKP